MALRRTAPHTHSPLVCPRETNHSGELERRYCGDLEGVLKDKGQTTRVQDYRTIVRPHSLITVKVPADECIRGQKGHGHF